MCENLPPPTLKCVRSARDKFDEENQIVERALEEIFKKYPKNSDPSHVLIKVATLNSLYSTHIMAAVKVAEHIVNKNIDPCLESGDLNVINMISTITIKEKTRRFHSFATKYAAWHKPELYPIWDSRVDEYLWRMSKQTKFIGIRYRKNIRDYSCFYEVITKFREHFGLGECTLRDIDKFI